MWERYWKERGRDFLMLGVAQDAQGEERVRPVVEDRGVTFPILIDRASVLARSLEFQVVPSGLFADPSGTIRFRQVNDFDINDPRVRWNLERFLAGQEPEALDEKERMNPAALESFARGVSLFDQGRRDEALAAWREALLLDPDNFIIRSQIWAVEHPERFYPVVDREWQELQLLKEGYDKPLP